MLSFGISLIVILVAIVSKIKTDLARDGALPQPRTTKYRCRLAALLWCAWGTHPVASVSPPRLCMLPAPRRLHERVQDECIN
jgi:hypothetical protein